MTAFDTDILSEILKGNAVYVQQAQVIDPADRWVPVVAAAEVLRGWLSSVRRAEAGKGRTSLPIAFREFQRSLTELAAYPLLPYTAAAETQVQQWRAAKVRIGSQDLRIAAICIAHGAKLVTRNARDYTQVPGLNLEIWN